jgi:hypothetical protein
VAYDSIAGKVSFPDGCPTGRASSTQRCVM